MRYSLKNLEGWLCLMWTLCEDYVIDRLGWYLWRVIVCICAVVSEWQVVIGEHEWCCREGWLRPLKRLRRPHWRYTGAWWLPLNVVCHVLTHWCSVWVQPKHFGMVCPLSHTCHYGQSTPVGIGYHWPLLAVAFIGHFTCFLILVWLSLMTTLSTVSCCYVTYVDLFYCFVFIDFLI